MICVRNAAQSVNSESPEDSDNATPPADDINGESTEDSDGPVISDDEMNSESTEGSDSPVSSDDEMNGESNEGTDNPETVADNDIPVANLQSLAADQSIANFPVDFSGMATSDASGITAVEILIHNTVTMENLQADGTMGEYAELQATLDKPDENATAWSFNVASLPPGPYYIAIRAKNGASQVSEWEATNFTVASSNDTVAPTITLRSQISNQELSIFPIEFEGVATDDISGIAAVDVAIHNQATATTLQADGTMGEFVRLRAKLENPGENTTAWSFSIASLPPGPYYIAIRAIDGQSQISEEQLVNFSVPSSIDSVAPMVTLQTQAPDQVIADFPIEFAGVATDELSGIAAVDINIHNRATLTNLQADGTMGEYVRLQAKLDNPGENATAWSFSVASLPPGPFYIALRAIDGESQISEPQITNFSVPSSVDNIAPTATLQSLTPDQVITDFPFIFAGDATDDYSGIAAVDIAVYNRATETTLQADGTMGAFARLRVTLDNPGENTTAWSFSVANLPPGPYYIAVRAIDGESQISEPQITDFSVPSSTDGTPPVITVQSQSFTRQ